MSKSVGNVINPDDVVAQFGADTLRTYEMFMGPIDIAKPWDEKSVNGVYKFLSRISRLVGSFEQTSQPQRSNNLEKLLHQTIRKVTEDIERLKFNTAIAAMMTFVNEWSREQRKHYMMKILYSLRYTIQKRYKIAWRENALKIRDIYQGE